MLKCRGRTLLYGNLGIPPHLGKDLNTHFREQEDSRVTEYDALASVLLSALIATILLVLVILR